jgi:hypothetical protein
MHPANINKISFSETKKMHSVLISGYSVMIITAGFELANLGLIPSTPTIYGEPDWTQ